MSALLEIGLGVGALSVVLGVEYVLAQHRQVVADVQAQQAARERATERVEKTEAAARRVEVDAIASHARETEALLKPATPTHPFDQEAAKRLVADAGVTLAVRPELKSK